MKPTFMVNNFVLELLVNTKRSGKIKKYDYWQGRHTPKKSKAITKYLYGLTKFFRNVETRLTYKNLQLFYNQKKTNLKM